MANADKEQPRGLEFLRVCLISREGELFRYIDRSLSSATAQFDPIIPSDFRCIVRYILI